MLWICTREGLFRNPVFLGKGPWPASADESNPSVASILEIMLPVFTYINKIYVFIDSSDIEILEGHLAVFLAIMEAQTES